MKRRQTKMCFLQAALVMLCLASAGLLIQELFIEPEKNRQMTERLKEDFPEKTPGVSSPQKDPKQAGKESGHSAINLTAMQAQYPDIQGWLTIPGTNVDYPVLQSGEDEPEYYLKRNYRGGGSGMQTAACSCSGTAKCLKARTSSSTATT